MKAANLESKGVDGIKPFLVKLDGEPCVAYGTDQGDALRAARLGHRADVKLVAVSEIGSAEAEKLTAPPEDPVEVKDANAVSPKRRKRKAASGGSAEVE